MSRDEGGGMRDEEKTNPYPRVESFTDLTTLTKMEINSFASVFRI
jgi:hypothetical protein